MILRNHGLLAVGETVADAFLMMYALETACQVQVLAQSMSSNLVKVPQPVVDGIMAQADVATKGLGGHIAWPALLRKLDRNDASYKS